jgi:hypothetical protein
MASVRSFLKMYWTISQHLRWDTHPHTHTTRTHVRAGTTVSIVLWVIRGKTISFFSRQHCLFCSIDRISGIRASFVILIISIVQILIYWKSLGVCLRTCDVLHPKCDRILIRYSEMRRCVHVCVCVCACVLTAKTDDCIGLLQITFIKGIFYQLS